MRPADWQSDDGRIQLYAGDCLSILPELEAGSVDAVVTDPPYGVQLGSRKNNNRTRFAYSSTSDNDDAVVCLLAAVLPECRRVAHRVILTPGVRLMWSYPKPDHTGIFFHPAAVGCNVWGFSCWQPILYYGKDPYAGQGSRPDSFECTEAAEKNGHPCPKPIGAWTRLLERATLPAETILDPFMGSGTTGVACVKTGRRFIGCEIDPGYFAIAVKRIKRAIADNAELLPNLTGEQHLLNYAA